MFPAGGYGDDRHYQVECRIDLEVRPRRLQLAATWLDQAIEPHPLAIVVTE